MSGCMVLAARGPGLAPANGPTVLSAARPHSRPLSPDRGPSLTTGPSRSGTSAPGVTSSTPPARSPCGTTPSCTTSASVAAGQGRRSCSSSRISPSGSSPRTASLFASSPWTRRGTTRRIPDYVNYVSRQVRAMSRDITVCGRRDSNPHPRRDRDLNPQASVRGCPSRFEKVLAYWAFVSSRP
jgi:hypothetical protein